MRFYHLALLLFYFSSLLSMEADIFSNRSTDSIQEDVSFTFWQPRTLFDITKDFIALTLLEQSICGKSEIHLRKSNGESILSKKLKSRIISAFYKYQGSVLWYLFPHNIKWFYLNLSNTRQGKLIENDIWLRFEEYSEDKLQLALYDINTLEPFKKFDIPFNIIQTEQPQNANTIFLFGADKIVHIYSLDTGTLIKKIAWNDYNIGNLIALSNNGKYIYNAKDRTITMLNTLTEKTTHFEGEKNLIIQNIKTISHDTIITGNKDCTEIRIWKLKIDKRDRTTEKLQLIKKISRNESSFIAIARDGKWGLNRDQNSVMRIISFADNSTKEIGYSSFKLSSEDNFDSTLLFILEGSHGHSEGKFKNLRLLSSCGGQKVLTLNLEDRKFKSLSFEGFFVAPHNNRYILLYDEDSNLVKIELNLGKDLEAILKKIQEHYFEKKSPSSRCVMG